MIPAPIDSGLWHILMEASSREPHLPYEKTKQNRTEDREKTASEALWSHLGHPKDIAPLSRSPLSKALLPPNCSHLGIQIIGL